MGSALSCGRFLAQKSGRASGNVGGTADSTAIRPKGLGHLAVDFSFYEGGYLMKRTEIRALFASAPADGASVTVYGEWQGWYVVHYGNIVGYAAAAYIDT